MGVEELEPVLCLVFPTKAPADIQKLALQTLHARAHRSKSAAKRGAGLTKRFLANRDELAAWERRRRAQASPSPPPPPSRRRDKEERWGDARVNGVTSGLSSSSSSSSRHRTASHRRPMPLGASVEEVRTLH